MKIAVITGANRGIGEALLQVMSNPDWVLIGTARNLAQLGPRTAHFIPAMLDVHSEESCEALAQLVMKEFGRLDVLINNAGIMATSPMQSFELEEIRQVMDTNFFGAMRVTKYLLPLLQNSADARIVNVSSQMGQLKSMTKGYASYRLSKWALNGFTMLLAGELANTSVKVNAVCPGWCQTEMGGQQAPYSARHGAEVVSWAATAHDIPTGTFIREKNIVEW
jgi:NAD(P)-dependent dehydrogenase (short-subunit alcohol dehydrogenase family)